MGSGASAKKTKYAASKTGPAEAHLPAIGQTSGAPPARTERSVSPRLGLWSGPVAVRPDVVHLPSATQGDSRQPSRDPSSKKVESLPADSHHASAASREARNDLRRKTSSPPRSPKGSQLASYKSAPDALHARIDSTKDVHMSSKSSPELRIPSKSLPVPRREDSRESSKSSCLPDVKDIRELYPLEDFEITVYAVLARLRPHQEICLQDFKEKPSMNGTRGRCVEVDAVNHVWTLELQDGRHARVLPPVLQKEVTFLDHADKGIAVKGVITYDVEIVEAIFEEGRTVRKAQTHIPVRPDTPPEERLARRRAREKAKEVDNESDEKVVKRKVRHRKKSVTTMDIQDDAMGGFTIGDLVHLKEAGGLGVGKIVGPGEKWGLVRVNFGNRGAIYIFKTTEIEHEAAPKRCSTVG